MLKQQQCGNFSKPLVLIVDDQPIEAELLKQQLDSDFKIVVAKSGEDAIEFCQKHTPDIIVLDVLMPEMDGIEVCQYVKQNPALSHIPVIFLTAAECADIESKCWGVGCLDFLSKPVRASNLIHRIKAHLTMKVRILTLENRTYLKSVKNSQPNWYVDFLEKQCAVASLRRMPMSLVLLNIQDFDKLIQLHGWLKVDDCLTDLSKLVVSELIRSTDIVVRYQRDSFLCILPDSGPEATRHFVFMLQQAIARKHPLHFGNPNNPACMGIAGVTKLDGKFDADSLLKETENCLEELTAQHSGKIARRFQDQNSFTQTLLAHTG